MKVKRYVGSLVDCIEKAKKKSLENRRLYHLDVVYKPPYNPWTSDSGNQFVDMDGTTALCVGVSYVGTSESKDMPLVSDSFAICIPVIAIEDTGTHLAHCNGLTSIDIFSSTWPKNSSVFVIKKNLASQGPIADKLVERLKGFGFADVEMLSVPICYAMGIIVIGSVVIAYPME